MPRPRVKKTRSKIEGRPSPYPKKRSSSNGKNKRIDAATLASKLQLQEERRELAYSSLALAMKLGLFSLGAVSLIKLSIAYHHRLDRFGELVAVMNVETSRLNNIQRRFDRLFTIGGRKRLMDEQDQWIEPNRLRIIWR